MNCLGACYPWLNQSVEQTVFYTTSISQHIALWKRKPFPPELQNWTIDQLFRNNMSTSLHIDDSIDLWKIGIKQLTFPSRSTVDLREDYLYHIRWIFGKLPNGLWPPPPYFRKTSLRFFREAQKFATKFIRIGVTPPPFSENSLFLPPQNFRKNRNEIFRIGNDPPPIRKFSENSLNLVGVIVPNLSKLCTEVHFLPASWGCCRPCQHCFRGERTEPQQCTQHRHRS